MRIRIYAYTYGIYSTCMVRYTNDGIEDQLHNFTKLEYLCILLFD